MRDKPDSYYFLPRFSVCPEAAQMVDETVWPGVTVLKVQMNTDLMTEDLKKKRSSLNSRASNCVELVKVDKRALK